MNSEVSGVGELRAWLRGCPAVERGKLFGVDYLAGDGGYSLDGAPSALRYRENILGKVTPGERQERDFVFAARRPYGGEPGQNLDNLEAMGQVAEWILERNRAGDFPRWPGGEVIAILPTLSPHPAALGSAYGRYQLGIKVIYRIVSD